jgi:DNA-binding NarL/FixJ family response regulator
MTIRCLIVDDNREFLDAARRLLEAEGITVVGTASNVAQALDRVAKLRPDVTLVDVNLGEESGFDLARRLADAKGGPSSRVILISTYAAGDLVDTAPTGGTFQFLSKTDLSGVAIRGAFRSWVEGQPDA